MYAISSPSDVYHLLSRERDKTVCGLGVVPIIIDRPVHASELHMTSNKPTDRDLCKDCARIEQEERQQGE